MKIQESAQDYLEAILILSQEKSMFVQLILYIFRLCKNLVSVYLKQLKENNYIVVDDKILLP